jgi:hypothetical protein
VNENLVQKCLDDIDARLQSIAILKGRVLFVLDDDEALNKIKGTSFPQVCYLYEGMRSVDTKEQRGISCEAVFGLVIMTKIEQLAGHNNKASAIALLDDVRAAMREGRSPVAAHWKFLVEAQAAKKDTVLLYLQRWSVPVQLV